MNANDNKQSISFLKQVKNWFSRTSNLLCIGASILFVLSFTFMLAGIKALFVGSSSQIYLYEDGIKYVGIEDGFVINELVLESGSALPTTRDYFNENYKLSDDASIKYYSMDNKEISEDEFTVTVGDTKFVKGIQDIIVSIFNGNEQYDASVSILDTTTPEVSLGNYTIKEGDSYSPENFVVSYFDNSSDDNYSAGFIGESHFEDVGNHDVTIEICDMANNCIQSDAQLIIEEKEEVPEETITQIPTNSGTTKQTVSQKKPSGGSGSTGNNKPTTPTKPSTGVNTGNNNNNNNTSNNPNKDYNSDNINNANNTQKSEDPNFWALIDYAQSFYDNPALAEEHKFVEETFIKKTNADRQQAGVPPLTLDRTLCLLAQARIREYESLGWNESSEFMHKRPDRRDFSTIFKDYGYVAGVYSDNTRHYGENYVSVLRGPNYNNDGAFNLLHNSPGHYANIVGKYYTKMGIAKGIDPKTNRFYWIQLFAS